MIQIGTSIREREIPFKYEIEFAKKNKYDFIQLWYKQGNINHLYEENANDAVLNSNIKIILHALMDIGDFQIYGDDLIQKLILFKHKEVIIHPVIKSMEVNSKNDRLLADELISFCKRLKKLDITVYVENNHDHMQTFYTIRQWEYFFENAPDNVYPLIDIVHVLFCNDYDYLRRLVNVKYPRALHIADTVKGMRGSKHLHLPIGDGIIDFDLVFGDILKDFQGLLILEINNTDKNMIESKKKIINILKDN